MKSHVMDRSETDPPVLARGLLRIIFLICGLGFVGCGYVGLILPGIPTTPFLLAAGYCFDRSSPRFNRWLRRSPVFGKLLKDWEQHRGIRRPIKILSITMVITVVSMSLIFSSLKPLVKKIIAGCAILGITSILLVPTIPRNHDQGPPVDS